MMQTLTRTARGLFSSYNHVHGIPEGGLLEATNVNVDRVGVISKIRGRTRYGAAASLQMDKLFEYRGRLFRHVGNDLEYDSDGLGTWTAFSGSFPRPSAQYRMKAFEALSGLFFNGFDGVWKKATLADEPALAGMPEGLDLYLTQTGTGAGMAAVDAQVGYRVLFGRTDANEKVILGAPSPRQTFVNALATGLSWRAGVAVSWTRVGTTVTVSQPGHAYPDTFNVWLVESSDQTALPTGLYPIDTVDWPNGLYTVTGVNAGGTSGTATAILAGAMTWTRVGSVITVSSGWNHNLAVGDSAWLYSSDAALPTGEYSVLSVLDQRRFTVEGVEAGSASGSGQAHYLHDTISIRHAGHPHATSDWLELQNARDLGLDADPAIPAGPYQLTRAVADRYMVTLGTSIARSGTLSTGKKWNLTVDFSLPAGLVAGDVYRVYRTVWSGAASIDPGDEEKLLVEAALTAGDLAAGSVSFTDTTEEEFLGERIYTGETQEGIANANARPPWCADCTYWKGHAWYLNTLQPHMKRLTLLSVEGLTDETSSITLTSDGHSRTYIFSAAENIGARKFQRFTGEATNVQNVERTAQSLVKVVNRDSGNSWWEARYVSGTQDRVGMVEFRRRTLNTGSIAFTADLAGTGDNFSPVLPTNGTTVRSSQDRRTNALYRSKFEQPEAVPLGAWDPTCEEGYDAHRILGLRDSLIILTEKGVYRMSGETDGHSGAQFTLALLDPTVQILAPEAACVLNNAVYALSTQGIVRVDESGTDLISHPIEDELQALLGYPNYRTLTHAVGYESDRKLLIYAQGASTDTTPTVVWVYNYLTSSWTKRSKTVSAACVLLEDDKLYEAHAVDFFVLKERKTFSADASDHQDEDVAIEVTATGTAVNDTGATVSTVTVNYDYTTVAMQTGTVFHQGAIHSIVEAVTALGGISYRLQLSAQVAAVNGAATLSLAIVSRVRWKPEACQNASVVKQFPEVTLYLEENSALCHEVGFFSDTYGAETFLGPLRVEAPAEAHKRSTPLRVAVPRPYQRCRALSLIHVHRRSREQFALVEVGFSFRPYGTKTVRRMPG